MDTRKPNFEQIPVEIVKQIACEFGPPAAPYIQPLEVEKKTANDWRGLACQVQTEKDPQRMIHLVQELIESLDREQGGRSNGPPQATK